MRVGCLKVACVSAHAPTAAAGPEASKAWWAHLRAVCNRIPPATHCFSWPMPMLLLIAPGEGTHWSPFPRLRTRINCNSFVPRQSCSPLRKLTDMAIDSYRGRAPMVTHRNCWTMFAYRTLGGSASTRLLTSVWGTCVRAMTIHRSWARSPQLSPRPDPAAGPGTRPRLSALQPDNRLRLLRLRACQRYHGMWMLPHTWTSFLVMCSAF